MKIPKLNNDICDCRIKPISITIRIVKALLKKGKKPTKPHEHHQQKNKKKKSSLSNYIPLTPIFY